MYPSGAMHNAARSKNRVVTHRAHGFRHETLTLNLRPTLAWQSSLGSTCVETQKQRVLTLSEKNCLWTLRHILLARSPTREIRFAPSSIIPTAADSYYSVESDTWPPSEVLAQNNTADVSCPYHSALRQNSSASTSARLISESLTGPHSPA